MICALCEKESKMQDLFTYDEVFASAGKLAQNAFAKTGGGL